MGKSAALARLIFFFHQKSLGVRYCNALCDNLNLCGLAVFHIPKFKNYIYIRFGFWRRLQFALREGWEGRDRKGAVQSTGAITQNRGYVAIPEVGDQVMVGFVHNHPDRPFVMGGMFHGGTALGGGSGNSVKSIMTRSGHKVIFTEDESIIITDKSGNEIHLDTTGSNITITAPETMTLNCKNMNINVAENMNTTVGSNQTDSIGMNRSQTVGMNTTQTVGGMKMTSVVGDASMFITGKLMEVIDGDVHSETKKERNEISHDNIDFSSQKTINNNAQVEVKNNSGEKSKNH